MPQARQAQWFIATAAILMIFQTPFAFAQCNDDLIRGKNVSGGAEIQDERAANLSPTPTEKKLAIASGESAEPFTERRFPEAAVRQWVDERFATIAILGENEARNPAKESRSCVRVSSSLTVDGQIFRLIRQRRPA